MIAFLTIGTIISLFWVVLIAGFTVQSVREEWRELTSESKERR